MTTSNLSLAQEAYMNFGRGDIPAVFAMMADDIVWNSHSHPASPFHGVFKGKGDMQQYFGNMAEVEIQKFDITNLVEAGEKVVALIDVHRVTKATGDVTSGQFVHVLQFADRKLARVDVYEASADKA